MSYVIGGQSSVGTPLLPGVSGIGGSFVVPPPQGVQTFVAQNTGDVNIDSAMMTVQQVNPSLVPVPVPVPVPVQGQFVSNSFVQTQVPMQLVQTQVPVQVVQTQVPIQVIQTQTQVPVQSQVNFAQTSYVQTQDVQREVLMKPVVIERPVRSNIEQIQVPGFATQTSTTPSTIKRTITTIEKRIIPRKQEVLAIQPSSNNFKSICLLLGLALLAGLLLWGLASLFRHKPKATGAEAILPGPSIVTTTKVKKRICGGYDRVAFNSTVRSTGKVAGTVVPAIATFPSSVRAAYGKPPSEAYDASGQVLRTVLSETFSPFTPAAAEYYANGGAAAQTKTVTTTTYLSGLPPGVKPQTDLGDDDDIYYDEDCEEILTPIPVAPVPPEIVAIPKPLIPKPLPTPDAVLKPVPGMPTLVIEPNALYEIVIETPPTLVTVTNVTTIPLILSEEILTTPSQSTVIISEAPRPEISKPSKLGLNSAQIQQKSVATVLARDATPSAQLRPATFIPDVPVQLTQITQDPIIQTEVIQTPIIQTPFVDTQVIQTPIVQTPFVDTQVIQAPITQTQLTQLETPQIAQVFAPVAQEYGIPPEVLAEYYSYISGQQQQPIAVESVAAAPLTLGAETNNIAEILAASAAPAVLVQDPSQLISVDPVPDVFEGVPADVLSQYYSYLNSQQPTIQLATPEPQPVIAEQATFAPQAQLLSGEFEGVPQSVLADYYTYLASQGPQVAGSVFAEPAQMTGFSDLIANTASAQSYADPLSLTEALTGV